MRDTRARFTTSYEAGEEKEAAAEANENEVESEGL